MMPHATLDASAADLRAVAAAAGISDDTLDDLFQVQRA